MSHEQNAMLDLEAIWEKGCPALTLKLDFISFFKCKLVPDIF